MTIRPLRLPELLALCAPMPALVLGVLAMRQIGVSTSMWSINLAACVAGLLIFKVMRYAAGSTSRGTWYWMAIGSVTAIVATFASDGMDGVHRWLALGSFSLHASAIVAPVIIACVATAPNGLLGAATAIATAILLALQPDAAQASSFVAGCGVLLAADRRLGWLKKTAALISLIACALVSLVRVDPLRPVRSVEGIFEVVSARGPGWALLATAALLLLPAPYLIAWTRSHAILALGLGVYVAMVTVAPAWGRFPVPIMGYGVSPILGYFIALALCANSSFLSHQ